MNRFDTLNSRMKRSLLFPLPFIFQFCWLHATSALYGGCGARLSARCLTPGQSSTLLTMGATVARGAVEYRLTPLTHAARPTTTATMLPWPIKSAHPTWTTRTHMAMMPHAAIMPVRCSSASVTRGRPCVLPRQNTSLLMTTTTRISAAN
ncbi:hypothetical protein CRUP_037080, partial [Coryphaenoides rupestris]